METTAVRGSTGRWTRWSIIALSCATWSLGSLTAWSDDDERGDKDDKVPLTVPKAVCGAGDLQGQVPAPMRINGFKGFNCNLKLVGNSRGDGASWQHAWFQDRTGHKCAYYDTSSNTAGRSQLGTVVVDVTHPAKPNPTVYLTSVSMLDPWESLRTNT